MSRTNELCLCLAVMALAATAGCGRTGQAPQRRLFLLEVVRDAPPRKGADGTVLVVRPPRMSPCLPDRELVYRMSKFRYECDYYSELLASAGSLIGEQTRAWLSEAHVFGAVVNGAGDIEPTHVLESNVTALHGDFTDKSSPRAVVAIEFFLVGRRQGRSEVLFHKTYRASVPVAAATVEKLVEAYSKGLHEILTKLEADLQAHE